ncbi:DUF4435 domain-containing protein [Marinomonas mediterranea]|uniref:DUF4435 domain-containing protein n=1 Tax=Marinomonas mediterranea TaxID=119864 RepID=UPI00234B89A6|nr:DUF4435 domain-containing protein [Marinomonas mediterranea]WCN08970.1 hypothetical protein GV055_08575 [Marinomonas mediterranea]
MSFTRTNSGLSNMALFHGVDMIVFTEGGGISFPFTEVLKGKFNEISVDIKFWSGIFNTYGFDKKVEFRALGSKTATNKICDLLSEGKINNIVVARDSDLDDFTDDKVDSPFILYTKGYSWENDVYHKELVKDQVNSMIFSANLKAEYIDVIEKSYAQFYSQAFRLLKLEILFRVNGVKLITDCNGERFVNGKSLPLINMSQVSALVNENKSKLIRPVSLEGINLDKCPIRFSYGKLKEALALANVNYIVGKLEGVKSLPKDFIISSMIDRYFRYSEQVKDDYYSDIIGNLMAA